MSVIKSIIGIAFNCPDANKLADFYVESLDEAVSYAIKLGAKKSEIQYFDTSTVMIDPVGHPFCLSTIL